MICVEYRDINRIVANCEDGTVKASINIEAHFIDQTFYSTLAFSVLDARSRSTSTFKISEIRFNSFIICTNSFTVNLFILIGLLCYKKIIESWTSYAKLGSFSKFGFNCSRFKQFKLGVFWFFYNNYRRIIVEIEWCK